MFGRALAALVAASLPLVCEAETLLVANKREATLTFLDPGTGIVRAAIPTGLDPHEVEVSGDGRRAVVSMYGTDDEPGSTITVVDVPSGKELRTVELEGFTRPHGIRWLRDDRHVWVTAEFETSLLRIDTETGGIVQRVDTGQTARTCSPFRPTASTSTPRTEDPARSASSTLRPDESSAISRPAPGRKAST